MSEDQEFQEWLDSLEIDADHVKKVNAQRRPLPTWSTMKKNFMGELEIKAYAEAIGVIP